MASWIPAPSQIEGKRTSGTSSSGTSGTLVCELSAASGKRFTRFNVLANFSSDCAVIVTYSDLTTDELASSIASGNNIVGNRGILIGLGLGNQQLDVAKDVTKVRIETRGAGVGQRTGGIDALEEPL